MTNCAVRWIGSLYAFAALLAIGCSSASAPQRESHGLVRVKSWKPGNLFAHTSVSIDDYDDIWLAAIGIQYAEGQAPLGEEEERRIRKMVYDIVLEEIPAAGQLPARAAGPCTLELGVHLAALSFARPGFSGPRNRSSAVVISELRDSETDEPLVRYGQRREFRSAGRTADGAPDLEQLDTTLREVLHDVGLAMEKAIPVNPTGARAARGCKGVIGDVRKHARAG
jgi:hypothetical protein